MADEARVVMIVDDEKDFIDILSLSLKDKGLEVLAAGGGEDAFAMLEGRLLDADAPKLDVIISDWVMPGCDGIELLSRIRKSQSLRDLPFILASGQVSREHLTSAIKLDADGVLLKPFGLDVLLKKIGEVIAIRQAKVARRNTGGSVQGQPPQGGAQG